LWTDATSESLSAQAERSASKYAGTPSPEQTCQELAVIDGIRMLDQVLVSWNIRQLERVGASALIQVVGVEERI
jgi:hypothetical protein